MKVTGTSVKKVIPIHIDDPEDLKGTLKKIGGSQSDPWNEVLVNQAAEALWVKYADNATRERQYKAAVAGLTGIGPKDELEGMIAAQLIVAHNAGMECHRRAMLGEQSFEGRRENLSQANKLSRTFAMLLEALNRHRGKGQQKVTVEHIHVHSGGQAVVGVVEPPKPGSRPKLQEQPHAVAYSPGAEMPRPNPKRQAVPVAGDAERPLPNARRNVARRSKG